MDQLTAWQEIISQILKYYADLPYSHGDLKHKLIISEDKKNYLLMTIGWENESRVHGCVVHLEIIDDKIWVHRDGIEDGIANELVSAGIPQNQIVLAFHPVEVRPYTGFAVK